MSSDTVEIEHKNLHLFGKCTKLNKEIMESNEIHN